MTGLSRKMRIGRPRLWTRELAKFWKWFGTYSWCRGFRKFTSRSILRNDFGMQQNLQWNRGLRFCFPIYK